MATGDPSAILLQYGPIGAFVVILGAFAWVAYKRERDRSDRLEIELAQANQRIVEANQRITDRYAEVLSQTTGTLRDIRDDYQRDMAMARRRE